MFISKTIPEDTVEQSRYFKSDTCARNVSYIILHTIFVGWLDRFRILCSDTLGENFHNCMAMINYSTCLTDLVKILLHETACYTGILTVEMLKKCPIWSIFKHHYPGEGHFFFTIAEEIHEILVVQSRQC